MLERTEHPLCVDCLAVGKYTPAVDVHHPTKRSAGGNLLTDDLIGLCKAHHSLRTARGE